MIELKGIVIENNFLQIDEEIGTLLFQEFNSTKLFYSSTQELFIREWVDCSDDGLTDRFFFFKTNKLYLAKFFRQEISHFQLINLSLDGMVYFQDISDTEKSKFTLLATSQVNKEYLPSYNSEVEKSDFVDYDEINLLLELENIDTYISITEQIRDFSNNHKTEVYNLHIEKGPGVGYGKINTQSLAKTLLKFNDFYENISLDIYLGKSRGKVSEKAKENSQYENLIQSEVIGTMAASFSILIKPKISEYTLFEEETSGEAIAKKIFNLIENSLEFETLKEDFNNYSEYTISTYKNFLKEIYSSGLNIGLSYFSDKSALQQSQRFNLNLSNKIVNEIENLKISKEDNFEKVGKFRALNCDTGYFTFVSIDGETFKGYLDKLIKDSSMMISFTNIYSISIERKIIKEAEKEEPIIKDTIIAYYLFEE
ncbi:hypothetical protein [Chryseobacterium sp.]|uniref:hypothetical protein n=1 Tax=Chryseobacterium sp. TaxID=1871047 RepID=UPI00261A9BEC|nr:hypothetical protein [Chryseobacterium sp.]